MTRIPALERQSRDQPLKREFEYIRHGTQTLKLWTGVVVVMDNLSAYKVQGVKEALAR